MCDNVRDNHEVIEHICKSREAWGTCAGNLMRATQNGRGLSGDQVNTVKYYDVMVGGYRSLRYENLVQVF